MNAPIMNEEQVQAPVAPSVELQQQMQQQAPVDDVAMAKEALGIDGVEQQLADMQAQLVESNQKAMMNEISSEFKDVPVEEVTKALETMATTNPQMAQMMQQDANGLKMMFQQVQSQMKPTETPDEITDSGDAGDISLGDFQNKLKDGNASEVDLGDFILANQ